MFLKKHLSKKKKYKIIQEELDFIHEFNAKICIEFDFKKVITDIISTLRHAVKFDGCNFALIDDDGTMTLNRLEFSEVSPKWKNTVESRELLERFYSMKHDLKTSPALMCVVARENKEIHCPDIQKSEYKNTLIVKSFGVSSLFYLPINLGNEIYGTLLLANYGDKMQLSEFEKEIIRKRTSLIAHAIENSKLYNELKYKTIALEQKDQIISEDLMVAKKIQNNVISDSYKKIQALDIQIYFKPMIEVGGDIYDIFELKENHYRLFLADATGHGVQAALATMLIKAEYDKIKIHETPVNKVLELFNQTFIKNYYKLGMFFSCVLIDIDLSKNKISYSFAGHPKQYIITDKNLINFNCKGKMIGIFDHVEYLIEEKSFKEGDKLVLFTDGLFEEFSGQTGEELEQEGLEKIVKKHIEEQTGIFMGNIIRDLNEFIGSNTINDDITFMVIKRNNK